MIQVFHLSAKHCSGRGVKIRLLTPVQKDQAAIAAAKIAGKDAVNIEYNVLHSQEMAERSLVAVTKKTGFKSMDEVLALAESEWVELTSAKLCTPGGEASYSVLFNAKDDDIICRLVAQLHQATKDEVDAIAGKALTVSED